MINYCDFIISVLRSTKLYYVDDFSAPVSPRFSRRPFVAGNAYTYNYVGIYVIVKPIAPRRARRLYRKSESDVRKKQHQFLRSRLHTHICYTPTYYFHAKPDAITSSAIGRHFFPSFFLSTYIIHRGKALYSVTCKKTTPLNSHNNITEKKKK